MPAQGDNPVKARERRWPSSGRGQSPWRKPRFSTPRSWTSGLQSDEKIRLSYASPPVRGTLCEQPKHTGTTSEQNVVERDSESGVKNSGERFSPSAHLWTGEIQTRRACGIPRKRSWDVFGNPWKKACMCPRE